MNASMQDDLTDRANEAIGQVCAELAAFLCQKNRSYSGSAFRGMSYAGHRISPEDAINVRIVDKLRRLSSADPNFDSEDSELDLLGYLIIKRANRLLERGRGKPAGPEVRA